MKRLLFYIILISLHLNLNAQVVYPIRSNTVLSSPSPYSLSGFVSEAGKMTLNIYVDDVNIEQYAVKFCVHIEGNGIKLSTRPDFYQPAYYLDGGMTHSLSGFELENLMNPNNLIFEGYSRSQYKKSGRLPEGAYRIWIDVLDYYRSVKVSLSSPSIAMIYLAKAPRLSFPADKSEIAPSGMPSIRFSWFSILPADPLADITYRFRLFEIRPEGRNPYEIAEVMQPIFQSEVNQSYLTYDLGMPPLISGQWYAWRVEAYDRENRVLFQNDGHSDVFTFRYGKTCQLPELRITAVDNHDVSLSWQADMNINKYVLTYKKTKGEDWHEEETDLSQIKINGLDDNTGYQIKIKSLCEDGETDFSRIQEFKTPREINYACGKKGSSFDLTNNDPLPSLGRFDEFKAADFIVEVEQVEGDNGNFSGIGYALVPYLGSIKFRVEFENIFINSDSRMTSGEIKFVYDEATGMVIGGNGGGDDSDETDDIDVAEELDKISDNVIESDEEVDNVVVVDDNTVVITYGNGSTKRVTVGDGKKVAVLGGGDGGQAYVVDSGSGKVFTTPKKVSGGGKGASSVGTASQTGAYGCSVEFLQAKNQRFGFDRVGDGKTKADSYFKTTKSGVKVPWKSLESGASDFADLKLAGTCLADSLRFIRNSGLLTPSVPQSKGLQVLLTGLTEGEEDLLTVATARTEATGDSTTREILTEVGALGLVSYNKINRDVVLVPVNGAQCPNRAASIAQELNKIYGVAVVDWTVTVEKNLEVDKIKGHNFEGSGTDTFSKYTGDMRSVIKEFKRERDYDRHSLYLFFIDDRSVSKSGFMPLASEFGFIFNFGSDPKLIAHELGHGKEFNLRHTFSDKAQHYFPERSTQNLMDYADGVELWKYQWDLIHTPENILFAWAQDEQEGAAQLWSDPICTQKFIEHFRWAYVNNKSLDYVADGYPWFGHFAKNMSLGDSNFEKITVEVKQDLGFIPKKMDYEEVYGRATFNYGKVLSISTEDKYLEASKYLFPSKEDWEVQLNQFVKRINPDIELKELLKILTILPESEYYRLNSSQIRFCMQLLSGKNFMTEDYVSCVDDEEIILNIVRSCSDDIAKQRELIAALKEPSAINRVIYHLDGDNHQEFVFKVAKYFNNVEKPNLNEIQRQYFNFEGQVYTKVFDWNETVGLDVIFESDNIVSTGEFKISTKYDFLSIFQDEKYLMKLGAFEYVSLCPEDVLPYLPSNYVVGESVLLVPAFLFDYILNEKEFEQALNDITSLVDIGFTVATLGTYAAGKTIVVLAKKSAEGALIDFGIQAFFNTLDGTSWEESINQVDYGNVLWASASIHISQSKATYTLNCIRSGFRGVLKADNESVQDALLTGGIECFRDIGLTWLSSKSVKGGDKLVKIVVNKLTLSPAFVTKRLLKYGLNKSVILNLKNGITKESINEIIDKTIKEYEKESEE